MNLELGITLYTAQFVTRVLLTRFLYPVIPILSQYQCSKASRLRMPSTKTPCLATIKRKEEHEDSGLSTYHVQLNVK